MHDKEYSNRPPIRITEAAYQAIRTLVAQQEQNGKSVSLTSVASDLILKQVHEQQPKQEGTTA